MITLLLIAGYVAIGLPAFRIVFRVLAGVDDPYETDRGDIGFGIFFGCIAVWGWPFVYVGMLFERVTRGKEEAMARTLGGESREQKTKRMEREAAEYRRKIESLERELDIR